jgi:glycosyltransferase involved in cell wall biosynthesis
MKILSVIQTYEASYGGPPEVLKNQIDIINKNKQIIKILKSSSLSINYLIKCMFISSYRLKIYNFLKKFDIIHFHEMWSIKVMFLVFFSNKILIKHFFVGHGYLDAWSINQKFIKKSFFLKIFLQPAYDSSIASFFSTKHELIEAKKSIKIHNSFIIPNGISLNKFKKRKLIYKKKKKILFFGRIHVKKGLDILINTIKNLPNNFFDEFTFEITGPGEDKDVKNLKYLIKKYALEKKVKYNSPIYGKKKIEYLKNYDVFILPSFEEGDSIALKEALGSYLPVIISKQCRLGIVEDYNAGIVVETNEKSLYQALIKLNSLDIVKMGYQARKLIEDNYDNQLCSQRLLSVYEDIFNGTHNSRDWNFN